MGTTKFSARLKLARAKAGMTQDELAKKAEMTQSKISTYELSLIHISEPTRP